MASARIDTTPPWNVGKGEYRRRHFGFHISPAAFNKMLIFYVLTLAVSRALIYLFIQLCSIPARRKRQIVSERDSKTKH